MSFRQIRQRDASGALTAAGYAWAEHKDTPGIPLYLLACAGVVAALGGLWVALVGDAVVGTPIVVGGLAVAWWGRMALRKYGHDQRSIVFRADDTVTTPSGTLPVKVSEIINVSNDVQFETVYVFFSLRDDRRFRAVDGRGLEHDEGLLVHDELSKAWDEMRRAIRPRASWPNADRA
ncbi:MAG TPA: hypothetical protein VEC14_15290 [Reyranellaceae bacterium]|nr:hypothetical protein [Reyranellaceae bacterium]